ncbi:adenosylmethionine--8-amino-7-oxononanoate transaminase [Helicobacter sp.]|uniref:adenosylmethionine--8-amino-7-oxononanoate transaminase n=1 Tax=Helicobacter sp. TaxID=218 RepID=UPI0025BCF77C|nr:adenosylmethionine--8-amino-7-oxononanoate transaminase [Helicobacter sp.]MCI5968822.1 adenosylmethionine--8-amino-7-oxononanoate transaminase [Helicobacter sp.]MDY2584981.1 adenosylmethionine--8-amino-7-oxononanoate transaminase [Helicobacter sp.]
MESQILKELDLSCIWHPCTQMHDHENNIPLIPIKRANGVYLYDFENKAYLDCISSWWVNLFGHCNPYINAKLKEQLESLEHIIFAGFTHKPIIDLSKRLLGLLGSNFGKCFYADNGSSAIEVALKMAFHASVIKGASTIKGNRKSKFLCLENAYHGETIGALSVGDVGIYTDVYAPILLETLKIKAPVGENIDASLEALKILLSTQKDSIIAFVLEPLIQCAGNMNMYNPRFVQEATKLCKEAGVYVIFDEIAVGFGRTGSLFAYEQCGVVPDFLCLSKGITGGYLPLSVVVTSDEIYQLFYAPFRENKAFLHSHSYTGNALACACANAVLDIFECDNVLVKNKELSAFIWERMQALREFSCVRNLRHQGMVFAFDLIGFEGERKGLEVFNKGLEKGLLLRPLGNTIYLMPPYILSKEEATYILDSICEILKTF